MYVYDSYPTSSTLLSIIQQTPTFDPSKRSRKQISDILMEVKVPAKAQRITALRIDDSFDVMKDAKQLIVAHKYGATIMDVVPN